MFLILIIADFDLYIPCRCVDRPLGGASVISPRLLVQYLRFSLLQELHYCYHLSQLSTLAEVRSQAKDLVAERLPFVVTQLLAENTQSLQHSKSQKYLKTLLELVICGNQCVDKNLVDRLLVHLRAKLPRDRCPTFLLPTLHPGLSDSLVTSSAVMAVKGGNLLDGALPDLVLEMGYHFTASVEECRAALLQLGGREVYASTVAKVIGVMVKTHTGLPDNSTLPLAPDTNSLWEKENKADKTWNVEVFIKTVHELQTTLNWKEIIYELDHPGFGIKDRAGLLLLMKALKLGLATQGYQGSFPIDLFYRHWRNIEGQVSLFQQILRNPDIFCFAEQTCHTSATEILKVQPDLENKEILTWRSLDLIETLLYMADNGHSKQVKSIQLRLLHKLTIVANNAVTLFRMIDVDRLYKLHFKF